MDVCVGVCVIGQLVVDVCVCVCVCVCVRYARLDHVRC